MLRLLHFEKLKGPACGLDGIIRELSRPDYRVEHVEYLGDHGARVLACNACDVPEHRIILLAVCGCHCGLDPQSMAAMWHRCPAGRAVHPKVTRRFTREGPSGDVVVQGGFSLNPFIRSSRRLEGVEMQLDIRVKCSEEQPAQCHGIRNRRVRAGRLRSETGSYLVLGVHGRVDFGTLHGNDAVRAQPRNPPPRPTLVRLGDAAPDSRHQPRGFGAACRGGADDGSRVVEPLYHAYFAPSAKQSSSPTRRSWRSWRSSARRRSRTSCAGSNHSEYDS